jgi:hypothetical protein
MRFLIAEQDNLKDIDNGFVIEATSMQEAIDIAKEDDIEAAVIVELDDNSEWIGQPTYL